MNYLEVLNFSFYVKKEEAKNTPAPILDWIFVNLFALHFF
ncbi:hypothetical protein Flavo103_42490 [Flavobacterium collinsii]|nr:hypothetical protein Flavo103_42490 [Flavobacterium collinsii]